MTHLGGCVTGVIDVATADHIGNHGIDSRKRLGAEIWLVFGHLQNPPAQHLAEVRRTR